MKTIATFIILIFLSSNIQKKQIGKTGFIEIRHSGIEEKPIKALIISTRKITAEELGESFDSTKFVTVEQKKAFLSLRYNFSVTDHKTYQSIIDFVNNNQSFFTNSVNRNHGDYKDYSINVNGKVYNIFYRSKDEFFNSLIKYIQLKKGDKFLIANLSIY